MNVLLVGAGRMGLRHLRGLKNVEGTIAIVDPRPEAEKDVHAVADEHQVKGRIVYYASMTDVPFGSVHFDGAILSQTAQGRADSLQQVARAGIKHVLVEKPMEQSRARFREILSIARSEKLKVRCNHYRRTLPFFSAIRNEGGIERIVVTGGAFGLACNGIHWIDFAVFLSKSSSGRLVAGEIEGTGIASGRGTDFRDYGGWGLFCFENGCQLFLSSAANSSAPAVAVITQGTKETIVDQENDSAIVYERDQSSSLPNYRYGADYERSEVAGIEDAHLWELTEDWIDEVQGSGLSALPSIEEASLAHELLFDLLEVSGDEVFLIT